MDFNSFSASLTKALDSLETGRLSGAEPVFLWTDSPDQQGSTSRPVLIGVGQADEVAGTSLPDSLVLNNKNAAFWGKPHWPSITSMLRDFGDEQWALVRAVLALPEETPPLDFFKDRRIVVEDASPDSVLSCYVLLLALADVADSPLDASFREGIDLWERGHTSCPGTYAESWPLLQAALSHQFFDGAPEGDLGGLNEAWIRSLRLLHHVMERRYPVHGVPETDYFEELHMARAAAELERQFYLDARQRSETLQLLLPLAGVAGREKLVDAFFLEEELSTGIAKVYLRNDKEHSALGKGYGLLVMNREAEVGTGNELSVSADPRERLDLTDLWVELERKEWEKRPERRIDSPRDLSWLIGLSKKKEIVRANQPWYLNEQFDLIAAPKPDWEPKEDAAKTKPRTSGSRLGWKDLKDAVWRLYNPGRNILVTELDVDGGATGSPIPRAGNRGDVSRSGPLAAQVVDRGGDARKRSGLNLRLFNYDPANSGLSFLITPTIQRIFAALILTDDRNVGMDDLPELESFDFVPIPGGFVVIHEAGALAFNDWSRTELDIRSVCAEFKKAKARYELIKGRAQDAADSGVEMSIGASIRKLMKPDRVWKIISDHFADVGLQKSIGYLRTMILDGEYRRRYGSNEKLLSWLNRIKLELDKVWTETEAEPAFRSLREGIEKRWGLERVVEELYGSVERLEETLRTASELRTERLVFILSFYGFPLVFFAAFFQNILSGWFSAPESRFDFMAMFETIHVAGLAAYLGLSGLVIAVLGIVNNKKK